jgi:nucleotide-binding universal stress UspA family protein
MYRTILLAAALQRWDRYSAHALAAREVAGAMALGTSHHLHVLSVYDYQFKPPASGLPAEMVTKLREEDLRRTNSLMEQKVEDYIAPLKAIGLEVTTFLRVGDPRSIIVQTADELKADALIIGSHSKRNFLDIALGGTAKYVSQHVPCTVILVSPEKQTLNSGDSN